MVREKPSLVVEHLLDWEFTTTIQPGIDRYIVDPKTNSLEYLEQAAWCCKEIESTLLSTLQVLPASYLDNEAVATDKPGEPKDQVPQGSWREMMTKSHHQSKRRE
jgi:hypothetical protein